MVSMEISKDEIVVYQLDWTIRIEVNDGFGKHDNESYVLRYMFDTETRDSLINTKDFVRPFYYTIKTTRDNELVDTPVNLVDTFNYLIGLHAGQEQRGHRLVV